MKTHIAKGKANTRQSAVAAKVETKQGKTSSFQFVDNRPKAVVQQKLKNAMTNGSMRVPVHQLQSKVTPFGGTVQLVNKLTMHSSPKDTRLSGGGKGSKISTGKEVNAVIASNRLQDMIDSHRALKNSIKARESSTNPDDGHAGRIGQEKVWMAKLAAAIAPLEQARLRSRQRMLSGARSPARKGPERGLPANSTWGRPKPALSPVPHVAEAVPAAVPQQAVVMPGAVPQKAKVVPAAVPQQAVVVPGVVPQQAVVMPGAVPQKAKVVPAAVPQKAKVVPAAVPKKAKVIPAAASK